MKGSDGSAIVSSQPPDFANGSTGAIDACHASAHLICDLTCCSVGAAAGDVRSTEHDALFIVQTLFLRNHNRLAQMLARALGANGGGTPSDDALYEAARALNIAEYQSIVFNEYLPTMLGNTAPGAYTGYNPQLNPTVSNEFASAAFRLGHSLVGCTINGFEYASHTSTPVARVH